MRSLCVYLVVAILTCPVVGCGDGGDLEGTPKDTAGAPATPGGTDIMKEKMEKKGARR